jgi:hypothetical protein
MNRKVLVTDLRAILSANDQSKFNKVGCLTANPLYTGKYTVMIRMPDQPGIQMLNFIQLSNGSVFKRHLNTGLICPVFKRSGVWINIMKTGQIVQFLNGSD